VARRDAALASSRKRPTSNKVSAVPVVVVVLVREILVLDNTAMPPGERSVGDVHGPVAASAHVP